jgi:hypothetical protein
MRCLLRSGVCATTLLVFVMTTAHAQVRATGYVNGTTVFPREAPSVVPPRGVPTSADSMPASTGFSRVAPRIPYSPGTYAPGAFTPGAYAPGTYAPGTYSPSSYTPNAYAPNGYVTNTYTPGTYTPNSYTAGSYTPNTYLTSRAPAPSP